MPEIERSIYFITSRGLYRQEPEIEVSLTDDNCVYISFEDVDYRMILDSQTASELSVKISDLLASI